MAGSLQDQLLGIGLVDKKKAKKISAQKRKQEKKSRKSNTELIDKAAVLAEKAIEEEKEHSRLLNIEKNQVAEQKAVVAQIKQLIEVNKLDLISKDKGDIAYNFVDTGKVKIIYVTDKVQGGLSSGQLAIVKLDDSYELVPHAVAQKIKDRDESIIVQINLATGKQTLEEDPYADYEIPDDLMW